MHRAIEAAEDAAEHVRIVVTDLRRLLDPLGSRVLSRALGRLEQHAHDLDKLAGEIATLAENGGSDARP